MKSEFKAKFLQNLVRKNKGNEGFTLIELLVVIIIVGVLAAIALPSFLNQIGKARGSEAKSSLGTVNRSQQAYRLENNTFATAMDKLDAKITPKFYDYAMVATPTAALAQQTAIAKTGNADIKNYASAVSQTAADVFSQLICENDSVNGVTATAPSITATASPMVCSGTSKEVK
jgi:type IV pilus assembly protein PilA